MDVVDNNPVVPANTVSPQPNLTPETPKTPEPTQKKKTPRKIVTIGLIIILIFVAILLTLLAFTYLERNRYGSATINNKNTTDSNIVSSPVSYINDSGTYTFQSTKYNVVFKYPTSMGNAKVETRQAPFNTSNEYVVFSKSSLEITYWGDEVRGFGSEYTLAAPIEDLTTKDNKPCQLLIRKTGKEYDIFASCYLDETYSTYKAVHFLQEAISMSELETAKSNVKSIIASLSFDISDLNSDQTENGLDLKFLDCPPGWEETTNRDYNAAVTPHGCYLDLGGNNLAVNNAISVGVVFVPEYVAATNQDYADAKSDSVKNGKNSEIFSLNGFMGFSSSPDNTYLVNARMQVNGGYYEIDAFAIGRGVTDYDEVKEINDIILTFEI